MSDDAKATLGLIVTVCFMILMWLYIAGVRPALAHDDDRAHDEWYAGLMQPDNPSASCCGLADAYWCDDYFARDGKAFCKITDDRLINKRPPIPVGTEIEIPEWKLKHDRGNPTGHAVVFLSSGGVVYCFVQGGGV